MSQNFWIKAISHSRLCMLMLTTTTIIIFSVIQRYNSTSPCVLLLNCHWHIMLLCSVKAHKDQRTRVRELKQFSDSLWSMDAQVELSRVLNCNTAQQLNYLDFDSAIWLIHLTNLQWFFRSIWNFKDSITTQCLFSCGGTTKPELRDAP